MSFPNRAVLEDALRRLDLLVVQDGFETPTTGARRRRAARRDLGREGRHLHQQRAPGVPGPGCGRAARARPAATSTSSSTSPSAGAAATSCSPGWAARRRLRRVAARVRRAAVRLQRHHLRAHRRGGRRAVAVPRRATPRAARRHAPPLRRPAVQPPDGRAMVLPVEPEPIRDRPGPSTRSCSTPGAPSSTGTPAPRPAASRSSRGCRPRRGSRCTRPTPPRLGRAGRRLGARDVARRGRRSDRVRVTAIVRPGEVFIPFHWDERCANRLTDDQFDPISREPNYKPAAGGQGPTPPNPGGPQGPGGGGGPPGGRGSRRCGHLVRPGRLDRERADVAAAGGPCGWLRPSPAQLAPSRATDASAACVSAPSSTSAAFGTTAGARSTSTSSNRASPGVARYHGGRRVDQRRPCHRTEAPSWPSTRWPSSSAATSALTMAPRRARTGSTTRSTPWRRSAGRTPARRRWRGRAGQGRRSAGRDRGRGRTCC